METASRGSVLSDVHWGYAFTGVLVVQVLMVAAAFAWVGFYSVAINPGHDAAFYEAYAQVASPISALFTGMPLFYLAAAWVRRQHPARAVATAIAMGVIAVALDVAVTAAAATNSLQWWLCLVNAPLKVIGLWLGARARG